MVLDHTREFGGKNQVPVSNRGVAPTCPANSLLFLVHVCLLKSSIYMSIAQARRIWWAGAGACRDYALVVAPRAFSHMVIIFRGRCEETSYFGGLKHDSS